MVVKIKSPTELKEESEKDQKERIEKLERSKEELEVLKGNVNECFATPAGIETLKCIRELSGFDLSSVALTKERVVDAYSTLYNEGRRSLYLELKKIIDKEILRDLDR